MVLGEASVGIEYCQAPSAPYRSLSLPDDYAPEAMKAGGITKIHHVDHESQIILGVLADYTTIVYGN